MLSQRGFEGATALIFYLIDTCGLVKATKDYLNLIYTPWPREGHDKTDSKHSLNKKGRFKPKNLNNYKQASPIFFR